MRLQEHAKALEAERAKQEALQRQLQDSGAAQAAAARTLEDKLKEAEAKVTPCALRSLSRVTQRCRWNVYTA